MRLNEKVFLILPRKLNIDKPSKFLLGKRQIDQTCYVKWSFTKVLSAANLGLICQSRFLNIINDLVVFFETRLAAIQVLIFLEGQ